MNKLFSVLLFVLAVIPTLLFAQNGKITGVIKEEGSNSPLAGVSVAIIGASQATSSDFEGDYTLEVAPGTYKIVFSYVGYQKKEITDIKVEAGKSAIVDVNLTSTDNKIDEVVITVSARKNTEQSILNMQKSSGVVMDGLSSQAIQRSGASNIASAVRVVPGVSVQEGKYLYVRGLGDRYTKSILNGVDIPGLDPDKNTVQMDIFPTGVLENIIVMKTASAELPADFTGGVIDIVTKDIPAQRNLGVSASLGYNPNAHFRDDFVSYKGSKTDFLGYDYGDRNLPVKKDYNILNPVTSENRKAVEQVARAFDPTMAARRQSNNTPDLSLGIDYSNQFKIGEDKLGVIGLLNYKRTSMFYKGFQNGIYQKPNQTDDSPELRADKTTIGDLGEQNVLLSGMLGLNYKTAKSKYTLNALRIQSGESRAAIFNQTTQISNSNETMRHTLEYTERAITNLLLSGKHSNENADFITEWKLSPTWVKVNDKDMRQTTFVLNSSGNYVINTDAGLPIRFWRYLDEFNGVSKLDFTKKLNLFERESSFKFGGLYSYKKRDYRINNYSIEYRNNNKDVTNGDPNGFLNPENVYDATTDQGFWVRGNYQASNTFEASQQTAAAYASLEVKPMEKLKAIIGLRGENYTTIFTGENVDGLKYDKVKTINKFDLFPSLNLIYNTYTNHNLRTSYSRTVARPSFKELSVVQIYDPLTQIRFLGNLELVPTYINNIDVRYEIFAKDAQMFALSGFYKGFKNPIELQAYNDAAPLDITPKNSPSATVIGLEFEGRKNFGFISEELKNLSLNLNVTVVKSEIEMGEEEYTSRQSFAREGQEISTKRQLQGQSPYLINTGLSYNSASNGLEAGVFYNVQGRTLEVIGFARNSDVYSKPFNSLNLNVSKKIGTNMKAGTISLKVDNLLDSKRLSVYEAFQAADQIYQQRIPGRNFSIGYSYNF